MRLLDIAIQLIITFTYTKATDNQSQLNVLIGIDFIREAINFKGQSVYDQISSTVSGVKPFNQTIGLDNYLISNLSLSDFVYRPEDLTIIVPSKVNLISLEISKYR